MTEPIEPEKGAILTTVQKLEERYEPIGKYAIGYWSYSKDFGDLLDTDPAVNTLRKKHRGVYLPMENSLYRAVGKRFKLTFQ